MDVRDDPEATASPAPARDDAAPASSTAAAPALDDLACFGVDAETGGRTSERLGELAAALRGAQGRPDAELSQLGAMVATPAFGLPPGADPESLADMGWGVIWGPSIPQEVKDALRPLLDHRRAEVGDDDLCVAFDHVPGTTARAFLQRHGADFGSVRPECVPYYLLLVGSPADLPFALQSALDVEYRVGRLDLADPAAYARYARAVVEVETGLAPARDRVLHAFGPTHLADPATALSVETLVRASPTWLAQAFKKLADRFGLTASVAAGDDATRERLLAVLRGVEGRPELLLTAGHGLVFAPGSARQAAEQGALLTADWDGVSAVDEHARFAASDVPDDADVRGMVALLFACYGAGTPATDSSPRRAGQALAPGPFVAALPRALLSHPCGTALGMFGHVDRTLAWSLQPPGVGAQTTPFARAVIHPLIGSRLGAALDDLNQRGATLASTLASNLRPGAPPIADDELVQVWAQQRDAAGFILLGDPAARLRR